MKPVIFIPLTRGKIAVIDFSDAEKIRGHSWNAQSCGHGKFYAACRWKNRLVLLHRHILQALPGTLIDHKNRNTLDCRRENLRVSTASQNIANQGKRAGLSSKFKGVCRVSPRVNKKNPWMAYVGGTPRKHLGYFQEEEFAALAHDEAAKRMFGEFAQLNFPL